MNGKAVVKLLAAGVAVLVLTAVPAGCGGGVDAPAPTAAANGESIDWMTELEPALAKAKETGKPVMVDFYATWCPPCKMLDAQTYTDAGVIEKSKEWVMVRIDVDQNKELSRQYGIQSIPTIVLIDPNGKEMSRTTGFVEAGTMINMMKRDA